MPRRSSRLAAAALLLALVLWAALPAMAAPPIWQAAVTLGNGQTFTGAGQSPAVPSSPLITGSAGARAGVSVEDAGACLPNTLDPARVVGKIVVCDNRIGSAQEKSTEVRRAGGVGMILVNLTPGPLTAEDTDVPTVHVDDTNGAQIKAYVAGTANPTASLSAGQRIFAPSTTTLSSSANPSTAGQSVTFTATVSAGSLEPTGTVSFTDGGADIAGCTAVAVAAGQATCTVATLTTGSHAIASQYSGDEGLAGSMGTLTQQVNAPPANRAPVARPDIYLTTRNRALTVAAPGVLANDSDADGNPLTAQRVLGPAFGTLTFRANGSFTYTPRRNFTGVDAFVYRVSDGRGGAAFGVVSIGVRR